MTFNEMIEAARTSFVFYFVSRAFIYIGGVICLTGCVWLHTITCIGAGSIIAIAMLYLGMFDAHVTYQNGLSFESDVYLFLWRRYLLKNKFLVEFNMDRIGSFGLWGNGHFYRNANFGDNRAIAEWLRTNLTDEYGLVPVPKDTVPDKVYFENEHDAIMFKLYWG